MSYIIAGHAIVDGTSFLFSERVKYDDHIFRVVDDKLKDLDPLLTRADRRVLDVYDAIWTGPNVDAMINHGIYLDLPSGIHVQAVAVPA